MHRLYLFNPGHEEGLPIPQGQSYTPPRVVRQMMAEQWEVVAPLAEEGDYIACLDAWLSELLIYDYRSCLVTDLSKLPPLYLSPWALERHMMERLMRLAKSKGLELQLPAISERYLEASHRSFATRLLEQCDASLFASPQLPARWFYPASSGSWREELETYLDQVQSDPLYEGALVLKRPYTSSGRGVFFLEYPAEEDRLLCLAKASLWGFSLEPKLRVLSNSSWLYYMDGDACHLRYVTEFYTKGDGSSYAGHYSSVRDKLLLQTMDDDTSPLHRLFYEVYPRYLYQTLVLDAPQAPYEGWLGIDTFTYLDAEDNPRLHPCVELNLRCTMGVLSALKHKFKAVGF